MREKEKLGHEEKKWVTILAWCHSSIILCYKYNIHIWKSSLQRLILSYCHFLIKQSIHKSAMTYNFWYFLTECLFSSYYRMYPYWCLFFLSCPPKMNSYVFLQNKSTKPRTWRIFLMLVLYLSFIFVQLHPNLTHYKTFQSAKHTIRKYKKRNELKLGQSIKNYKYSQTRVWDF